MCGSIRVSRNLGAIVMGIASRGCVKERVFPRGVTGDRFSRRENLMEKSEVSDTDAPAIRQAIHGSSLRALLFGVAARQAYGGERERRPPSWA